MKKIFCFCIAVLIVALAFPLAVGAAGNQPSSLPYLTNSAAAFIDFATGSDASTGAAADSAKKTFGSLTGSGVISCLPKGGTLVVSGKAYVGASYTMPKLSGTLLITSSYNGTSYQNAEPANNPACAFKMLGGATFKISSNVILDNVIVFQENAQNSIIVPNGTTLVVGTGVVSMTKQAYQMKIVVETGGTAIINGGNFEVENNGGNVYYDYEYAYNRVNMAPSGDDDVDINVPPAVAYINYNTGSNSNSGTEPSAPKKQMLSLSSNGAMNLLRGGGTLVATGRLYIGDDYTIPQLGSQLTITGAYGGTNYMNPEPESNPAGGVIKLANGKTLTIATDTRFENIYFFQEGATQNVIRVTSGATLTIGPNVVCLTKQLFNVKLYVESGAYIIFESASHNFESIEGDGIVVMPEDSLGTLGASRAYADQFVDVTVDKWFYDYVKTAYEHVLANGTSTTVFSPDNCFTVAQALTAAANIHTAYYGETVRDAAADEAWYAPYVEYCTENNIISASQFDDYSRNITRGEMAIVFAHVLPDEEYVPVREGMCLDVVTQAPCYEAVAKLYRAGIVSGDGEGGYRPDDEIVRSEACVIFTRLAVSNKRAASV